MALTNRKLRSDQRSSTFGYVIIKPSVETPASKRYFLHLQLAILREKDSTETWRYHQSFKPLVPTFESFFNLHFEAEGQSTMTMSDNHSAKTNNDAAKFPLMRSMPQFNMPMTPDTEDTWLSHPKSDHSPMKVHASSGDARCVYVVSLWMHSLRYYTVQQDQ